jgi:hypothetical protein
MRYLKRVAELGKTLGIGQGRDLPPAYGMQEILELAGVGEDLKAGRIAADEAARREKVIERQAKRNAARGMKDSQKEFLRIYRECRARRQGENPREEMP